MSLFVGDVDDITPVTDRSTVQDFAVHQIPFAIACGNSQVPCQNGAGGGEVHAVALVIFQQEEVDIVAVSRRFSGSKVVLRLLREPRPNLA